MQLHRTLMLSLLGLLILCPAHAGHSSVPVGKSGVILHDTAIPQDKHYLKDDDALLDRIYTLMCDMDNLLAELHALPAELAGSAVTTAPVHTELLDLIQIGLNHNPGLAVYRSEEAVLAAKTRQAGALKDPMAMFTLMNFPAPQFSYDDEMMTQIMLGFSQEYESYGKRKLRQKIVSIEGELKSYSLAQRELDLVGQITDLYFDITETKARIRVLDEHRELLGLLVEYAERKLALGMVPQAQVINAQIELTELESQRINLVDLLAKQQIVLLGLLGNPEHADLSAYTFQTSYPLPISVLIDKELLLSEALELRPDYQRFDLMIEQQEQMVELAHRGYRPDYTISINYGIRWGLRDTISAGISFPLFTNKEDRQDAELQESYAMVSVTHDMQSELVNDLKTRLAELEVELDQLVDTSDLYRNAMIPQARLSLDSSIDSFAADRLDLSDLIMSQRQLENHEIEVERLYIDYLRKLSELQVLTAGAFDPLPYLAADPGALVPAGLNVEGYSVELTEPVPSVNMNDGDGFIDSLELPTEYQLEPGNQAPPDGGSTVEDAKSTVEEIPDEEPSDDSDNNGEGPEEKFYKPFNPSGK